MDWQQVIALTIVGLTAGLLAWSKLRRRPLDLERQCGSCCASSGEAEKSSIVFHARKGADREIRVKMR